MAWFVALVLSAGTGQMADVIKHDFRGSNFVDGDVFTYFGGSAKAASLMRTYVRPSPEGMRFTLPGREQQIGMMGFTCKPALPGDFDITLGYELLATEVPVGGYGMGISLWAVAETPASDIATVGRRTVPGKGDMIGTDRAFYTPEKKDVHDTRRFSTTDRRGKLRLTRIGEEIVYSSRGENDADFQEHRRMPYPAVPLKGVRITADTGNGLGELDLVVTDLHIRGATGAAGAVPGPVAPPPGDRGPRLGWLVGLLILLLAMLAGGVAFWRVKRM